MFVGLYVAVSMCVGGCMLMYVYVWEDVLVRVYAGVCLCAYVLVCLCVCVSWCV